MKKICFLFIATLVSLTNAHAQDQKKDVSSKTMKTASNKKILNAQLLPAKISNPVHPDGGEKMLNPQPLPPKADKKSDERSIIIVSGLPEKKAESQGNKKMLNPQSLPPKERKDIRLEKKGNEKMLNPQPLPPKESAGKIKN